MLLQGADLCVLTCGAQCGEALAAALDLYTQDIRPTVVNLSSVAPLDKTLALRLMAESPATLVVDAEHLPADLHRDTLHRFVAKLRTELPAPGP